MVNTNKDFIDLRNVSPEELIAILKAAQCFKKDKAASRILDGKSIGLLFTLPSTRTRCSFLIAAHRMGGHAELLSSDSLQLKNNESLQDTAAVLGSMFDVLAVRTYDMTAYGEGRAALNLIAHWSTAPVINALDDKDHPCQIVADLLTMHEQFGPDYRKKKLVLTWGYSKRQKSPGVPHSWLTAAALLGMDLRIAHPVGFDLDPEYINFAHHYAQTSGANIEFSHDLNEAADGADVIYVKNWKSLSLPTEEDTRLREQVRANWCVSEEHFKRANPGAIYMDCMPLIRGEQVTAGVADGPNSVIYAQAKNRIYSTQAILSSLL